MVFLILEAHGALHFRSGIDECAQWIAGQRVVVAAGVYIFKFFRLMVAPLGVRTLEEKAFNLIGGVERVAFFLVHLFGKAFEDAANIGRIRLAAFVDHIAEDQHFAWAKDIGRSP